MSGALALDAVERLVGEAPASQWLPALRAAIAEGAHGTGPSGERDKALLRVLDKAVALAPDDGELRCMRGALLTGRSDFDAALEDFARAVTLSPRSPRPLAERAYLRQRQGDWAAALADLDRAAALGEDPGRGLDRALVLLSLGRAAEARALLEKAAAGANDPELKYQLGRALVIEGKPGEAARPLGEAAAGARPDSRRKRPYEALAALAQSLDHLANSSHSMKQAKTKKAAAKPSQTGCLWLFGVGIDRPYEITLDTVMSLKRCDAVYTQSDAREVRELLEAVYPGLRSIPQAAASKESPQDAVWKRLREELDRGSQTGYVTYGHPMLYGEGNMLAKRCRDAGYRYRVLTAPSSIDGMLTMLQDDLDLCERGFCVGNARTFVTTGAQPDPSRGALILGVNRVMEEGTFGEFCSLLEKAYGPEHPALALKCADGYREEARLRLTVGELRRKERELDPALSLFIPESARRRG